VASIQDRWRRKDPVTGRLMPTAQDGQGLRYRPQFRDPSGRQVAKSFALKRDAQRWLDEQTAHIARGTYVDPGAGASPSPSSTPTGPIAKCGPRGRSWR
jgi:hypothetical protein